METSHNSKAVLLLGGAGYIGSHLAHILRAHAYQPIIVDDLSSGVYETVSDFDFFQGDYGDAALLEKIYRQYEFSSIIHLASHTQVGESTIHPLKYYQNNIIGTLSLLQFMKQFKIQNLLFSSSASVYGEPQTNNLILEHQVKLPVSPYGRTKWMLEQILTDIHSAYEMNIICLRYFNVAGVCRDYFVSPPYFANTNLIPRIVHASIYGDAIRVFGTDYPTRDGTCIRDYIHVMDICQAHVLALEKLLEKREDQIQQYNLGTGVGHTVLEVIKTAEKIIDKQIQWTKGNRRIGDPAMLVADGSAAMQKLAWSPKKSNLKQILEDAWT